MNPGLLNLRIRLERQGAATDALGQPVEAWSLIVTTRARRLKPDASQSIAGDRETETRRAVFRVRSRPFATSYAAGDRLVEFARPDHPEATWRILGVSETEGTNGMYSDVACESPAR